MKKKNNMQILNNLPPLAARSKASLREVSANLANQRSRVWQDFSQLAPVVLFQVNEVRQPGALQVAKLRRPEKAEKQSK